MAKQPFSFNFTVHTETKEEAVRVLTAFQKLAKVAETKDLETIANKVEKNPSLISKALKFI